jgi:2,4-dichlorophenol 6-monooxygenase
VRRIEIPVLVIGGGPVGMMASLLLAQLGIENLVVERRPGPHRAPQAHVVNPRTLEICRQAGIDVDRLQALATPTADASQVLWMTNLSGEELGRLPYERQGDDMLALTPTPLINLSQHRFEPILLEYLRALAGADIRYRQEASAPVEHAGGVTTTITDRVSGERCEVHSETVLAADGAGSRTREALGIQMIGPDRIQSFVMIHFEAALRPVVKDRPGILYWTVDPECGGAFVAHDIDRTWVFMHPYDPDTDPTASYTEDRCAAIVRRAIGRNDVPFLVRDVSPWTMTAQVADRYRAGRVFLVGDAAHRFPPSGGLGMNTGIHDVHNLVWKLAAVRNRRAGSALLDTYEAERRPVAEMNSERSTMNALRMIEVFDALGVGIDLTVDRAEASARMRATLADPFGRQRVDTAISNQAEHFDMLGLHLGFAYAQGALVPDGTDAPVVANPVRDYVPTARPGSRLPHAWVGRDGGRVSTLDLAPFDCWTLVTGRDGARWADAAATLEHPLLRCRVSGRDFEDQDDEWAELCGIGADGAVLVRPDQHVAWRAPAPVGNPAALLEHAMAVVLARGES